MNRRTFLATGALGVTSVASGCSSLSNSFLGPTHNEVENAWVSHSDDKISSDVVKEGTIHMDEGEFYAQAFSLEGNEDIRFEFQVQSGGAIDAIILEPSGLEAYRNAVDMEFPEVFGRSDMNTRDGAITGMMPGGDYYIVWACLDASKSG